MNISFEESNPGSSIEPVFAPKMPSPLSFFLSFSVATFAITRAQLRNEMRRKNARNERKHGANEKSTVGCLIKRPKVNAAWIYGAKQAMCGTLVKRYSKPSEGKGLAGVEGGRLAYVGHIC